MKKDKYSDCCKKYTRNELWNFFAWLFDTLDSTEVPVYDKEYSKQYYKQYEVLMYIAKIHGFDYEKEEEKRNGELL
jgi:hypothetical protein